MALVKQKIGDLISPYNVACNQQLSADEISGVNREKDFFEPARQVGADTTSYKVVPPGYFACNLMHVGRDVVLPIAYNSTLKNKIVSPAYTIFCVHDQKNLNPFYLSMMMKSQEMDRFFWFFTDSSVRDGLSFSDFCEIELALPTHDIQQKYVNIYKAMVANLKAYENGLENLKLTCDGYIDKLKKVATWHKLSDYIELVSEKNIALQYSADSVKGVNTEKQFIPTKADLSTRDLTKFQIVRQEYFVFNHRTSRNGSKFSIAYNNEDSVFICTEDYVIFRVKDSCKDKLIPLWLYIYFARPEFDRYVITNSWGSSTEFFNWEDICNVNIPVPDISIQKSIADIFSVYNQRKKIAEKMRENIKSVCPVLVQGAVREAMRR